MDNVIWQGDKQVRWHEETLSWKSIPQIEQYNADIAKDALLSKKWFEIDSNNQVVNIITAESSVVSGLSTNTFIQARKTGRINYMAGIGYSYSSDIDDFIPPQPYPSWILNQTTLQWYTTVGLSTGRVTEVGVATGGSGYVTSTNVETFNISTEYGIPTGTGLILNINVVDGVIVEPVEIVTPGTGYCYTDMVGIVTSSVSSQSGSGSELGILGTSIIV